MSDMAYVDVVFGSDAALAAGRAEIVRRMTELRTRLPGGAVVTVGPAASATGWVLQYALLPGPKFHAPMGENAHLTHQSGVRSVREVSGPDAAPGAGGGARRRRGGDPGRRDERGRGPDVGGPAPRRERRAVRRDRGALRAKMAAHAGTADEITRDPLLSKVTQASVVPTMAGGEADVDGSEQVVIGTVIAKRDADPMAVIARVKQAIEEHRHHLPSGASIHVLYDRSELAGRVEHTLLRAVAEEVVGRRAGRPAVPAAPGAARWSR